MEQPSTLVNTEREWIERETAVMEQLGITGQETLIATAARKGFSDQCYFIPSNLDREQLLNKLTDEVGVKLYFSSKFEGGKIPTTAGTLECDLAAIIQPVDYDHLPITLFSSEGNMDCLWIQNNLGHGLTKIEETLYLLIRHYMAFGRNIFTMSTWRIRCYNHCDSGDLLIVGYDISLGLYVSRDDLGGHDWGYGAVERKFREI